jgi:hypothetical protein
MAKQVQRDAIAAYLRRRNARAHRKRNLAPDR